MSERHYEFFNRSPAPSALFVGLAIGYTSKHTHTHTHETGYPKESVGDKFQKTRSAQLRNTIKVIQEEKYEVNHDVVLVVLLFGVC
jgi:hypothetical protein